MSLPRVQKAGQVPNTPGTLSRASQRPYAISTLPCVVRRPEVTRPSLSLRAMICSIPSRRKKLSSEST